MRLAIADPPYLGRADRWYGDGRGPGRTRATTSGRNGRKPDHHPDAADWDRPERHVQLVHELAQYDGWALAGAPDYLGLILTACRDQPVRVAIWHRPNAMPAGGRVLGSWEPVVYRIPDGRRTYGTGHTVRDVLTAPVLKQSFLGAKPPAWTRWVLDMLGYQPDDDLTDLFPGSGAVAAAAAMLPIAAGEVNR